MAAYRAAGLTVLGAALGLGADQFLLEKHGDKAAWAGGLALLGLGAAADKLGLDLPTEVRIPMMVGGGVIVGKKLYELLASRVGRAATTAAPVAKPQAVVTQRPVPVIETM